MSMRTIVSKRQKWWPKNRERPEHAFLPDPQVAAGVPIQHFVWAARYLCSQKPDVIVFGGGVSKIDEIYSEHRWDKAGTYTLNPVRTGLGEAKTCPTSSSSIRAPCGTSRT